MRQCIQFYIDLYYLSYHPSVYKRTYGLQRALMVDDFVRVDINSQMMTINLTFKDSLSYGPSLFYSYSGFKPTLINSGWEVKRNVWFKNIEHFGWQKPSNFIENGIEEFKREVNDESIHVFLNGEVM